MAAADSVQLTLRLGDEPGEPGEQPSGLPEMTTPERMRAELEILGLDVSQHAVAAYDAFLDALPADRRSTLVAGEDETGLVFDVRLQGDRETVFLTYPRHSA